MHDGNPIEGYASNDAPDPKIFQNAIRKIVLGPQTTLHGSLTVGRQDVHAD